VRTFALRVDERSWKSSSDPHRTLTRLEADVLAAQWLASRPDFDQTLESSRRLVEVRARLERANLVLRARRAGVQSFDDVSLKPYLDQAARGGEPCTDFRNLGTATPPDSCSNTSTYKNAGPAFFDGKLPSPGTAEAFDPEAWEIRPPDASTVESILAANDIKYTKNSNPTSCPVHDKGPVQEALLKLTSDTLTQITLQLKSLDGKERDVSVQNEVDELIALQRTRQSEQRKLTKEVHFYHQHLEQYATSRTAIKGHEGDVRMGDGKTTRSKIVWYRDFVNHHDCDGNKIHDYVLVAIYRDSTDRFAIIN
jgi:hypothetical protein